MKEIEKEIHCDKYIVNFFILGIYSLLKTVAGRNPCSSSFVNFYKRVI